MTICSFYPCSTTIKEAGPTTVTDVLVNFEKANPKPIANVSTTAADRELALKMAFSLSVYVLQDMMKAALIYKVLNPTFYQSLDNASLIRDTGIRHEDDDDEFEEKMDTEALTQTEPLAEKKEVEDAPSAMEMLENNVQVLNAESPTLPAASMNGQ